MVEGQPQWEKLATKRGRILVTNRVVVETDSGEGYFKIVKVESHEGKESQQEASKDPEYKIGRTKHWDGRIFPVALQKRVESLGEVHPRHLSQGKKITTHRRWNTGLGCSALSREQHRNHGQYQFANVVSGATPNDSPLPIVLVDHIPQLVYQLFRVLLALNVDHDSRECLKHLLSVPPPHPPPFHHQRW